MSGESSSSAHEQVAQEQKEQKEEIDLVTVVAQVVEDVLSPDVLDQLQKLGMEEKDVRDDFWEAGYEFIEGQDDGGKLEVEEDFNGIENADDEAKYKSAIRLHFHKMLDSLFDPGADAETPGALEIIGAQLDKNKKSDETDSKLAQELSLQGPDTPDNADEGKLTEQAEERENPSEDELGAAVVWYAEMVGADPIQDGEGNSIRVDQEDTLEEDLSEGQYYIRLTPAQEEEEKKSVSAADLVDLMKRYSKERGAGSKIAPGYLRNRTGRRDAGDETISSSEEQKEHRAKRKKESLKNGILCFRDKYGKVFCNDTGGCIRLEIEYEEVGSKNADDMVGVRVYTGKIENELDDTAGAGEYREVIHFKKGDDLISDPQFLKGRIKRLFSNYDKPHEIPSADIKAIQGGKFANFERNAGGALDAEQVKILSDKFFELFPKGSIHNGRSGAVEIVDYEPSGDKDMVIVKWKNMVKDVDDPNKGHRMLEGDYFRKNFGSNQGDVERGAGDVNKSNEGRKFDQAAYEVEFGEVLGEKRYNEKGGALILPEELTLGEGDRAGQIQVQISAKSGDTLQTRYYQPDHLKRQLEAFNLAEDPTEEPKHFNANLTNLENTTAKEIADAIARGEASDGESGSSLDEGRPEVSDAEKERQEVIELLGSNEKGEAFIEFFEGEAIESREDLARRPDGYFAADIENWSRLPRVMQNAMRLIMVQFEIIDLLKESVMNGRSDDEIMRVADYILEKIDKNE